MKKIILSIMGLFALLSLWADEPQTMPQTKNTVLLKNAKALKDASAIQVVENDSKNGVVATYKEIFNKVDLSKKIGDMGAVSQYQENKNLEDIFITGLNHDTITADGMIFHKKTFQDEHFLIVWQIGIEQLKKGGRTVRLKKFTVDPQAAAEYFAQKTQSKK